MSEKMTEEALSELFADVLHEWGEGREVMLRHHIAALEAELAEQKDLNRRLVDEQCALTARAEQAERERDEARRIHAANVEAGIELAKEFNRVGGIGYEADGVFRRARALLSLFLDEKAARERAEKERDEARRLHGKAVLDGSAAVTRAERAEADNAALLEGVEALSGMSLSEPTRAAFVARLRSEPHPGAAILERLRALERVREAVETVRRAIIVVGRTAPIPPDEQAILDACAAADALKGEAKTSPATEAQTEPRHATRENGDCAQWCKACRAEAEARTQPESSTEEAFATVRESFGTIIASSDGACRENAIVRHSTALALLERRIGAMRRALNEEEVARDAYDRAIAAREPVQTALYQALAAYRHHVRAALTDAPDVFTQEEVREACISNAVDVDAVQAVLEDLAALRKR